MKVLIWVGSFFIVTIINIILGFTTGFRMGYIPLSFSMMFVPMFLCRLWDKHKFNKRMEKVIPLAAAEGMSVDQYMHRNLSQENKDMCEFYRGNEEELLVYLNTLLEIGKLDADSHLYLFEKYR